MITIKVVIGSVDNGSFMITAIHGRSSFETLLFCEPKACFVGSELYVEWEYTELVSHRKVDGMDKNRHGIRYNQGRYEIEGSVISVFHDENNCEYHNVNIGVGTENMTLNIKGGNVYSGGNGIHVCVGKLMAYDCNL